MARVFGFIAQLGWCAHATGIGGDQAFACHGEALELMDDLPVPDGTVAQLRSIHRFLFQDVYDSAGEIRTINITKGGSFFLPVEVFDTGIRYCEDTLQGDGLLRGMDHDTFVKRLSVNYDNFNVLHPFREGNGRTSHVLGSDRTDGWMTLRLESHGSWGERPGEHNGATRQ